MNNPIQEIHRNHTEHPEWYVIAALDAAQRGHDFHIVDRKTDELYLSRFWLTPPLPTGRTNGGTPFRFENSIMLHYFHKGDHDQAMHDHPCDFVTTILSGGYTEQLPPDNHVWFNTSDGVTVPGPQLLPEYQYKRRPGDRIERKATDLHLATDVLPKTWTLVSTGNKVRSWGFHPPGKSWVGYAKYLGLES